MRSLRLTGSPTDILTGYFRNTIQKFEHYTNLIRYVSYCCPGNEKAYRSI